jgi:hypothetical protein
MKSKKPYYQVPSQKKAFIIPNFSNPYKGKSNIELFSQTRKKII